MTDRQATINRQTSETRVEVTVALDGAGQADVRTGVGFLDHMLRLLAFHGLLDLTVRATGDLDVDDHHTVEDVAIALGQALRAALGDAKGIERYGDAVVPMDESLARVALDVGGRSYCVCDLPLRGPTVGGLNAQLLEHFFDALTRNAGITLHVSATGRNDHHLAEAAFKALGRALRRACAPDPRRAGQPVSTKDEPPVPAAWSGAEGGAREQR